MTRIRERLLAVAFAGVVLGVTPSAHAVGSVGSVLIANIQIVTSNGTSAAVLNFVGGVGGSRPACATFPQLGLGIDVSTAKGKLVLNYATAAFLASKKVDVSGTGGCFGASNSIEIIDSLTILP